MPRVIPWLLSGIGIPLLLVGLVLIALDVSGAALTAFGILLIGAAIISAIFAVQTLNQDQVIDSWSALIEGGQGSSEQVFGETHGFIEASQAPNLTMVNRQIAPGFTAGLMGRTREFLVISENGNPKLGPYEMLLSCRDYGDNLDVNWYVTFRPGVWPAILSLLPFGREIQESWRELDLFDQQDLRAYTTNAHRCMLKAVDALMLSLAQDPSKIERRSRGFLGIS